MSLSRTAFLAVMMASLALPAVPAQAGCLRGINLSGAEFGQPGGKVDKDYTWPSDDTVGYFAGKGFDAIRIPFMWERLQPKLMQPLDKAEFNRLKEAVALARLHGQSVILDPHNYARYRNELIGSDAVPVEAFADFWTRLAKDFANQSDIRFGLMNEPNTMNTADWLVAANAAIAAIRTKAGASNLILVPGNSWTGAHSWFDALEGGSNATIMSGIKDPASHFAYEVHQYLDSDFSGTHESCSRADDAVLALKTYTDWLRKTGNKGYLGEFGGSAEPACLKGLTGMVDVIEANRDVWLGWSYWVAGDWWPESEALNIQPTFKGDRPQLLSLLPVLALPQSACSPQ